MFQKGGVAVKCCSKTGKTGLDYSLTSQYIEKARKKAKETPVFVDPEEIPVDHEKNMELQEKADEEAKKTQEEIQYREHLKEEREKQARIQLELAKKEREQEEKKKEEAKIPKLVTMENVPADRILGNPDEEILKTEEEKKEKISEEMELENKYPQAEPSLKNKKVYFTDVIQNKAIVKISPGGKRKLK